MKANCEYCGKIVDDNKATQNDEGHLCCDKCVKELTVACCCCGSLEPMFQMSCTTKDEMYCQDCATAIA